MDTEIPKEYQEFSRLFNDEAADRFPPSREWDHAIDLKPGAPETLDCKVYPMTRDEDTALEKFLDEMVAKGYIRPSKSPYTSPFFFVKKKDGKLRPVQDYRQLNSHTVRNQYPLPLIAQLISDLSGAHIFSKFDVRQGYNNVQIKKGDEWKAAFKTKFGHWEPLVMFFGLTNSTSTFQEMMNVIYKEVIERHMERGTVIRIYMDDIAIATTGTLQDHIDAVQDILRVAEEHDLYFKPSKCMFHASSIDYLGVIIEKGMTRMDPIKIAGIKNWPTPTKIRDIRSFLRFCNFYRPFIQGFAHLARPLNKLTRKDTEWAWEKQHQQAFEELKTRVTMEPVLAHPVLTDPFELEVDASGFAMGAVLLQKKEDGKKHPIAYYSKTLSAAEWNYDVYDLELLAIVNALDHWRPYLAGSPHKIIIYSDHQNLLYWKEPHKISRCVAREVLMLSEYNFEIRHIKGITNRRADALSRCQIMINVTIMPKELLDSAVMTTWAESSISHGHIHIIVLGR
jgi:ribonuclease HI